MKQRLTEEMAGRVYDELIDAAGANPVDKDYFIWALSNKDPFSRWVIMNSRFGKSVNFWNVNHRLYVTVGHLSVSEANEKILHELNERLQLINDKRNGEKENGKTYNGCKEDSSQSFNRGGVC